MRPGRIWYAVTVAILAAGIVWLIYGLASVGGVVDGLQRVPLPGSDTISLTHSGGYTLYYEGQGARNGDIPLFHVSVAPSPPGSAVARLAHYQSTVTYNIGSHQGRAVLSLQVNRPGRFTVTTTGTPPGPADLAVGASIGSAIARALVPAIPLIIVGFTGTLLLLIIRLIVGRSARRVYR